MWNDNDFDPGLGLALCSLAAVATKLQTAGPYLHTLSARPPLSGGFVTNTQTQDLLTQVLKPPADTQLNAQLFILSHRHLTKQTLSLMQST